MLWLSVSVSYIRYSKRRKFRTKMRLAAGLRPDPLGELERSPILPSRNRGECLLLRGKGRGKGKEGDGKGKGEGREKRGRGGNRGKGKDDLHPTLFLGPGPYG